ncbi:MAG: hypothetical protein ACRDVE_15185 [Actinocrinis sp.]
MDLTVLTYIVYLVITIALTVWVGRTFSRAGLVFLSEIFHGDQRLAEAVNHLFVVGFCLVNLGFDALWLRYGPAVADTRGLFEALSVKIGTVLLILGVLHLADILVLNRYRRRALTELAVQLGLPESSAPTR